MTNQNNTVLYTGVTHDLARRVAQHKSGAGSGFTSRYNICKLVYAQRFPDIRQAIAAEKKIKAGPRAQKVSLIEGLNPDWQDLKP
jgi:putative endonuclease